MKYEDIFEVGGNVLCTCTHEQVGKNHEPLYVRGKTYIVDGIRIGCKHNPLLLLLREVTDGDSTHCKECKAKFEGVWHRAVDFVPIILEEVEDLSTYTPEELIKLLQLG